MKKLSLEEPSQMLKSKKLSMPNFKDLVVNTKEVDKITEVEMHKEDREDK